MVAIRVYNYTMEIPLSTILRFGPCGVPALTPMDPPLRGWEQGRVVEFEWFEVSVMYAKKSNTGGPIYPIGDYPLGETE